jgi:predicted RNA-binding Zn-ribbon protein involved in translation (DUF1610 family)
MESEIRNTKHEIRNNVRMSEIQNSTISRPFGMPNGVAMSRPSPVYQLQCLQCGAQTLCGPEAMLARLHQAGMLRREKEPQADLVRELFLTAAGRFACPDCGAVGLRATPAEDEFTDGPGGSDRPCEACGRPIPAERIDLFPQTRLCVDCQRADESGLDRAPAEYCRRCGSVMLVRPRRGDGLAGYELVCPECRRKGN